MHRYVPDGVSEYWKYGLNGSAAANTWRPDQLRHIRGVRDVIEPRWLPYPLTTRSRLPLYPPPSVYSLATYQRLEQHDYDDLQQTSYQVLEASFELNADELHGGVYGGGDIRDQDYLRFVVVMQPGLPRRTLQVAVPA